mmetsp:Transcript_23290/g.42478  ORF Transcript_23290/g.42478 Transcript_23290/m.42478 type:complete len:228 (+) Transcript_23290:84-767(+)
MDPFFDWEVRETRGFVMRGGYCKKLQCRRNPDAPKECRGRNSFSRRAGGHRDVTRCSMCKPGRHHGPGGAKSLKKVGRGHGSRSLWKLVYQEARSSESLPAGEQRPQQFKRDPTAAITLSSGKPRESARPEICLSDFWNVPPPPQPLIEKVPSPPQLPIEFRRICSFKCRCTRGSRRAPIRGSTLFGEPESDRDASLHVRRKQEEQYEEQTAWLLIEESGNKEELVM